MCISVPVQSNHNIFFYSVIFGKNILDTFGNCELTQFVKHYAHDFSISCTDKMDYNTVPWPNIRNIILNSVFFCTNIRSIISVEDLTLM